VAQKRNQINLLEATTPFGARILGTFPTIFPTSCLGHSSFAFESGLIADG
jgi:hypothetical protein